MRIITLIRLLLITTVSVTSAQDAFLDKGNNYLNNEQFDKAAQTFREAIKSDTTNLIYQYQLALTLIQAKKTASPGFSPVRFASHTTPDETSG